MQRIATTTIPRVKLPRAALLALAIVAGSAHAEFKPLEWVALLPAADYQALLTAPPIQHTGGDNGTAPPPLLNSAAQDTTLDAAMYSTEVRTEYNNQDVSLPGFIVPLEYDENQQVTEFFLVPYFGACIHVPPPPPNQIVYVAYAEGIAIESIQEPFVVEGRLTTAITSNDTALSAYRMDAANVKLYKD